MRKRRKQRRKKERGQKTYPIHLYILHSDKKPYTFSRGQKSIRIALKKPYTLLSHSEEDTLRRGQKPYTFTLRRGQKHTLYTHTHYFKEREKNTFQTV